VGARIGRKSKLTPELQAQIVLELSNGSSIRSACEAVDITPATYCNWMVWGAKQSSGAYFEFVEAIKKVEEDEEAWHVRNIKKHSEFMWTASAWYLERKHPDKWAKREPVAPQPQRESEQERLIDDDALVLTIVKAHPELREEIVQFYEAMSR
jgi:hypothetical protein